MPPKEHIETAAYYLWQNAGYPDGHQDEFWYRAERDLIRQEYEKIAERAASRLRQKLEAEPELPPEDLKLKLFLPPRETPRQVPTTWFPRVMYPNVLPCIGVGITTPAASEVIWERTVPIAVPNTDVVLAPLENLTVTTTVDTPEHISKLEITIGSNDEPSYMGSFESMEETNPFGGSSVVVTNEEPKLVTKPDAESEEWFKDIEELLPTIKDRSFKNPRAKISWLFNELKNLK